MPRWLLILSWVSLCAGLLSASIVAVDILAGNRQKMWIMNIVWPITMLYSGPLGLWCYFQIGRQHHHHAAAKYLLATTHCGAGCTLGDILSECCIIVFPSILFVLGYQNLWQQKMFSAWILDFIFAFVLGILFQYFAIVPMKNLSPGEGILAAFKADALSLTAWQVGMYGWMAIATFAIFHHALAPTQPLFWFMMQIGMLAGLVSSYPINIFLVKSGTKESM